MTKRRIFSDKFKAAVALEALRGNKTVQEITTKRQQDLPIEGPLTSGTYQGINP